MNPIIVATICAMCITFGQADIKTGSLPNISAHVPSLENIIDACVFMGKANYSVSSMSLDSPQVGGCVHFDIKNVEESMAKTFTLWLDNLQNGKQQCRQEGMEQINFSCEEFPKTSIGSSDDGTKFVRLYGSDVNKKGVESIRCALFEKDEINSKIFRLAVSGNNSCIGLAKVFSDELPTIPEGANFLRLTRDPEDQEHQSRDRRSVINPTPTVQNQDWSTVWTPSFF